MIGCEPRHVVDVDLDDLPDRVDDRGRTVYLVVWHRELVLGIAVVPRDQLPLGGQALRDAAVTAALGAIWAYLYAPDAEMPRTIDDAPPMEEVLALGDPFTELHRRLDLSDSTMSSPGAPSAHDVSVVICTRDRPDDLERCLNSLRSLDPTPGEVIVVDNASRSDATRKTAEAANCVNYVREDRPGLDIARNAGIRAARGAIVAFTDDDVEIHPSWIGRIVQTFADPDVAAMTGLVLPVELDSVAQTFFESFWGLGKGCVPRTFGPRFHDAHRKQGTPVWDIGAGANMAFRRTVLDEVGGFDERLDVGAAGCSGDSEQWYRILDAGHRIHYSPLAVVRHRHRTTQAALREQIRSYMRGHTAALLVQYETTGDRGNLVRLAFVLPRSYALRALMRLVAGPDPSSALLGAEVAGSVSGVVFWLRHRRRPGRSSRVSLFGRRSS